MGGLAGARFNVTERVPTNRRGREDAEKNPGFNSNSDGTKSAAKMLQVTA